MKRNNLILIFIILTVIVLSVVFSLIKNDKDSKGNTSNFIVTVSPEDRLKLKQALEAEPKFKETIEISKNFSIVTLKDTPENWAFINEHATVKLKQRSIYLNSLGK